MKRSLVIVTSLLAVLLVGCGPAPEPLAAKPKQLAIASSGALSVALLSMGPLVVGQNRVFYRVTGADGAPVPYAHLEQLPLMKMETMQHGCPVLNPDQAPNADGLWEGLLVFTMASTEMDVWTLKAKVALEENGAVELLDFGQLTVADSTMKKVLTRDTSKIILTLGYPEAPHVGSNPFVITAHQAKDMMKMEYVTVDDLVFTVTPEMPSMGHGASGSINPVRGEDGLYRGSVVFSMAGDWVVHLGVAANDSQLGTYDFALDL